jgi:hypothetical protein
MPRLTYLICLVFLALTTGLSSVRAEEMLPPILQKLTDEAYRCYSSRETDNFFDAVKQIKAATEFSGY